MPENIPETITIAKLIRIEHRATPTPRPTPKPIVRTRVVAETHVQPKIVNPGNPSQQQHIRRVASARAIAHTHYHSKPAVVHVPTGGHGAGTSTTAKVETGGVGPGGNGTGESGNGNGSGGAPAATEPCGEVWFEPNAQPTIDASTGRVWEHMSAIVHYPDATTQTVDLDYEWYFPSQSQDPFLPQNKNLPDPPFQFPPLSQRASEPPVVQYIIAHSTPDGHTLLRDCPSPAP